MTGMPAWYGQLKWSHPAVPVVDLVAGARSTATIAAGAGLYAFTSDDQALSPRNALYIGKADGARQTLRSRLRVYVRRLRRVNGRASKHAGLELLRDYFSGHPQALFVRWCGCILTRDVEGGLIDLLDPMFNGKDERLGLADDERIQDLYLYDV